jgi:flagellar biogenesis protein FliO
MTARLFAALLVLLVVGIVGPAGPVPAACAAEGEHDAPAAGASEVERPRVETAGGETGGFLSYEEPQDHPQPSFTGLMLRLVLSMAIILGLIYGALLLFRLLARKAKAAPKAEKLIRIIDRAALDPKRAVYLIKVVDRLLVIGVGTNEVRTLAQIDDETVVDNVQEPEFSGHLQSLLGRLVGRQN